MQLKIVIQICIFSFLSKENRAINLRDNDQTPVINSADTDRAILQNSVDMAALLATTKGFISQSPEFDVVSKGLTSSQK